MLVLRLKPGQGVEVFQEGRAIGSIIVRRIARTTGATRIEFHGLDELQFERRTAPGPNVKHATPNPQPPTPNP